MPIYEYRCLECGALFEELVRNAVEEEHPLCPRCKSPRTEKVLSAFAVKPAGGNAPRGSSHGPCGPSCGCA